MSSIYAAIDIGSNAIKIKIIQVTKEHIEQIEDISTNISLGDDVFFNHSIKLETIRETLDILLYYKKVMDSYSVVKYKAVATAALRKAENAKNVIEIIRMRTGFVVDVIDDAVEKFLTYKSIRDYLPNYKDIRKSSLLIEVTSGSFDISLYHQNKLIRNDEIALGTKILKQILYDLEDKSVLFPNILKEFIETKIARLNLQNDLKKTRYFLAFGGEIKRIRDILFNFDEIISYNEFKKMCSKALQNDYAIRKKVEESDLNYYEFLATMIVYDVLTDQMKTDEIIIPNISLRDGLLTELIEQDYKVNRYNHFNHDIDSLAFELIRREHVNENHIKWVSQTSLKIYQALSELYSFDEQDQLLLKLGAILHEIDPPNKLFGVDDEHLQFIKEICKVVKCDDLAPSNVNFSCTANVSQVRVNKISAILRLAKSLDISKKQKVDIVDVDVTDESLVITIQTKEDIILEEWQFELNQNQFSNTFGIIPLLKIE